MLGSEEGEGWLSGAAIRPIAMRCIAEIAKVTNLPVIAVGGVSTGEDAIEFMMAGASAVQVCTAAILEGQTVYGRIVGEMDRWLDNHGYDSVEDIQGLALKHIKEKVTLDGPPRIDLDLCNRCGLCPKSCVYDAITVDKEQNLFEIDEKKCQSCGMCISVCPYHALSIEN
jgi:ferredoxin